MFPGSTIVCLGSTIVFPPSNQYSTSIVQCSIVKYIVQYSTVKYGVHQYIIVLSIAKHRTGQYSKVQNIV